MSLLALIHLPGAFLTISTVLAGYCLFRFYAYTAGNQQVVPYLLVAGALIAMADSAWTNVFSAAAREEAEPELQPGGGLSPTAHFFVAVFLSLAGLMCSMTGGYGSFRAGFLTIFLLLAKAAILRRAEVISPLLTGLIAGMLFVIGMTAHSAFMEMLYIRETRLPPVLFSVYMILVSVLAQVRESSRPRPIPEEEEQEAATRVLDVRDAAIDRPVLWVGGLALLFVPMTAAWSMPRHWLSWAFFILLDLVLLAKLIPALVYRSRSDLNDLIESAYLGGALLNAGAVASLAHYRLREVYQGHELPLPPTDELVGIAAIALLAAPAWFTRRKAEAE